MTELECNHQNKQAKTNRQKANKQTKKKKSILRVF